MPNETTPDSQQIISLPEGGGAVSGIGQTFSPDLHTGTGNLSIPISVPAGRRGLQPSLTLGFSTGSGNSPFGFGMGLSIPGVSRSSSRGLPTYDIDQDTFVLSGAEDLVYVGEVTRGGKTFRRYRPRTEGLFAHILFHDSPSNPYWEVYAKNGLVSFYGTPDHDLTVDGRDPATTHDPADPTKIYSWHLSKTQDTFGNHVNYHWLWVTGSNDNGLSTYGKLYPHHIEWIDWDDGGTTEYLCHVHFNWEARTDAFSSFRMGWEERTTKRCEKIRVESLPDPAQAPVSIRDYVFDYDNSAKNGASLVRSVTMVGHKDGTTESMPPLLFDYTPFEPKAERLQKVEGPLPAATLDNPTMSLVDMNGNGLPDLVEMNGVFARWWKNRGEATFDPPRMITDAPRVSLADPGVQLMDADGDGRLDLMVRTGGLSGYFPMRFDGTFDGRSFQAYDVAPSFPISDPNTRLIDLNGDGVIDALRTGAKFECYFQKRPRPDAQARPPGWEDVRARSRKSDRREFPDVNFADPRVKLADMTGDGMMDIVLIEVNRVVYWPNLGFGRFGTQRKMSPSIDLPKRYDPRFVMFGDVDGDGCADLVYVADGKVHIFMNQMGNGFDPEPVTIAGTPRPTNVGTVQLVDLLGNGVPGLLWTMPPRRPTESHWWYLDLTGGVKPYLMNQVDNQMGAITQVEYRSSVVDWIRDDRDRSIDWETPLPSPMLVVGKTVATDAISKTKLVTEYAYHHGYWDGRDREFRGFGRVDATDTEAALDDYNDDTDLSFLNVEAWAYSPPRQTRTWFHQGAIGDPYGDWREKDYSQEYWSGDGTLLEQVDRNLPTRRADKRLALRTLRGSVLRTELYALDGSSRQDRPYTVTEGVFDVSTVTQMPVLADPQNPKTDVEVAHPDDPNGWAIFYPRKLAGRATEWDRGDEPMTSFSFTGDFDDYGQPRRQTAFAVPRYRDPLSNTANPDAEPYLVTVSETTFAKVDAIADDTKPFMVDRVATSTSWEVPDNGNLSGNAHPTVFELKAAIEDDTATRTIQGQALSYYDGNAHEGLALGQLGDHGIVSKAEQLVATQDIFDAAYPDNATEPDFGIPVWLASDTPTWDADTPQDFSDQMPQRGGYIVRSGGSGVVEDGWFAIAASTEHNAKGQAVATRDPLAHTLDGVTGRSPAERESSVTYDGYDLLPTQVTDPNGLVTSATYDYRVFKPTESVDVNDNHTRFTFDALGFLTSVATLGNDLGGGSWEGDDPAAPSARFEYDLYNWVHSTDPVTATTYTDTEHDGTGDTLRTTEYSDGFGRIVQKRVLAPDTLFGFGDPNVDPALSPFGSSGLDPDMTQQVTAAVATTRSGTDPDHVVVSGWTQYNNKGEPVRQYEPFYATGWGYDDPVDTAPSASVFVEMHYDARGRVVETLHPDGSKEKVVFGVPGSVSEPDLSFGAWTPSDANLAGWWNPGDAHDLEVATDGSMTLLDRTGLTGDVSTPGTTAAPGELNGRVGVQPNDSGLRTSISVGTETYWFFGVVKPGSDLDYIALGDVLGTPARFAGRATDGSSTTDVTEGAGTPGFWASGTELVSPTRGDLATAWSNGAVVGIGPLDLSTWTELELFGPDPNGTSGFSGVFGECLLVADSEMDADLRATIEGYLAHQWGLAGTLPTAHPHRDEPPQHEQTFEPTPWERYAYGRNDLAGLTHPDDSTSYASHYFTPASMTVDAMGRVVEAVARNHQTDMNEWFVTKTSYDIRGNVLTVTDPLDRVCAVQVYDLADRSLRTESIDAGTSWIAFDAAGQPRETRDPRGARIWTSYDTKMRQTHQWACSSAAEDVGLRVHMVYGDGASGPSSPKTTNHNDRVWKQYDETGRCVFESYDFKGNLEEKIRRVIDPQHLIDANRSGTSGNNWEITPWETDWAWGSGETLGDREAALLDGTDYRTSTTYDALSRATTVTHPLDVESERKVTTPSYNRAGALESVTFDGETYIDRVAYNARGERILLALGNGVMTRYVHDRNTGRLRRLRSEQYTVNPSGDYVPSGAKFQDNGYAYDLSGNILGILDRSAIGAQANMANTSSSTLLDGYPHPMPTTNTFLKRYTYDPTGRLLTADGAEHGTRTIADPWSDLNPKVQDLSAIDSYTESYTYDANGSMTGLNHTGDVTYARQFAVESNSNRLTSLTQGSNTYNYVFDAAGQMTQENTERHFGWNHAGRLRNFRNQVTGSQASVSAHYLYGPDGERRVKVVSKQNGPDVITLYIEGGFEHRERRDTGGTTTNEEYQIGGEARTARLRVGTAFASDSSPAELYFLQDHLGSIATTIQTDGSFFSREEYTPYGESAYGSFDKKRYRFSGNELDEETLFVRFGERFYSVYHCRWTRPDPSGLVDGPNLYRFVRSSPLRFVDRNGKQSNEAQELHERKEVIGTELRRRTEQGLYNSRRPNIQKLPDGVVVGGKSTEQYLEDASLAGAFTPVVGDFVSMGADGMLFLMDPNAYSGAAFGVSAAGAAIPGLPSMGFLARHVDKLNPKLVKEYFDSGRMSTEFAAELIDKLDLQFRGIRAAGNIKKMSKSEKLTLQDLLDEGNTAWVIDDEAMKTVLDIPKNKKGELTFDLLTLTPSGRFNLTEVKAVADGADDFSHGVEQVTKGLKNLKAKANGDVKIGRLEIAVPESFTGNSEYMVQGNHLINRTTGNVVRAEGHVIHIRKVHGMEPGG